MHDTINVVRGIGEVGHINLEIAFEEEAAQRIAALGASDVGAIICDIRVPVSTLVFVVQAQKVAYKINW